MNAKEFMKGGFDMQAIIGLILQFIGEIIADVINTQLSTMGETYEIKTESGSFKPKIKLSDIFDDYPELD